MTPDPPLSGPETGDSAALRAQLADAPTALSAAGEQLWKRVAGTWVLRPDDLRVLADAAREADLIDRLAAEVVDAPLMVRGSQGQQVASPLVSEVRQHRTTLAALLRQLRLPDDSDGDGGLTDAQKSAAARSAARARWDRSRGA